MNKLYKIVLENELERLKTLPEPEYREWSCGQSDADSEALEYTISELEWSLKYINSPKTTRGDYEFYGIVGDLLREQIDMCIEEWQQADLALAEQEYRRETV